MKLVCVGLLILPLVCLACPVDEVFTQACVCYNSFSGLSIDCSGSNFEHAILLLQSYRGQLGLIQEYIHQNSTINIIQANAFQNLFIKKIDLSHNNIQALHIDTFRGLENVLEILSLKDNHLTQMPTVAITRMSALLQLDLSENDIGDLGEEIIVGAPKLFDINLSGNRICSVAEDAFKNVKHSVQTVNLGQNCLTEVPASAMRGFQQLLAIHLPDNSITAIGPLQFMNLPSINLINLARNQIATIDGQAFLNVPNLKFLYLSNNSLNAVNAGQFSTFEQLELLDLSNNDLTTIASHSFANIPRLAQLYLSGNRISSIQPGAFANSSLVILLLADNELTYINNRMFSGLESLQQLSLKHNKISQIDQDAFYQMPGLVILDLSNNELSGLPPSAFLAQLNLFMLDLGYNHLAAAPYHALNQKIVSVMLNENPLVCTERVHVIQNGVGMFVPGTEDGICGGSSTSLLQGHGEIPQEIESIGPVNPPTDQPDYGIQYPDYSSDDTHHPVFQAHPSSSGPFNLPNNPNTNASPQSDGDRPVFENVGQLSPFQAQNQHLLPTQTRQNTHNQFTGLVTQGPAINEVTVRTQPIRPGPAIHPSLTNVHPTFNPPRLPSDRLPPNTHLGEAIEQPIEGNEFDTVGVTQAATLPPNVIIADTSNVWHNTGDNNRHTEWKNQFAGWTPVPRKKPTVWPPDAAHRGGRANQGKSDGITSTVIAVALTAVIVVLVVVLATLCVVRQRRLARSGSTSRTSAYVAAHTLDYGMTYRQQGAQGKQSDAAVASSGNAWLYTPGTYQSAASFYDGSANK